MSFLHHLAKSTVAHVDRAIWMSCCMDIFTSHCMFRRKKRPYQDYLLQLSVSMAPAGQGNLLRLNNPFQIQYLYSDQVSLVNVPAHYV